MKWTNKISKSDFILLASVLLILPAIVFYTVNSDSFETRSQAETTETLLDSISFADLNDDNQISITDYAIWVEYYVDFAKNGKLNSSCDFNGDGRISIADFSKWLEAYISYVRGSYIVSKRENPVVVKLNPNYSENDTALVVVEDAKGEVYFSIDTELTALNYETAGSTVIPTGNGKGGYRVYWYCTGNDNYYSKRGEVVLEEEHIKPEVSAGSIKKDNEVTLVENKCGSCMHDTYPEDHAIEPEIPSSQLLTASCPSVCQTVYDAAYSTSTFGNKKITRDKIEKIYTVKEVDVPADAKESWDVSEKKDKSVVAYVLDKDSNGLYELYLGENGGVIANQDSSRMFENYTSLTYADLTNLYTDNVTDMSFMFKGDNKLSQLIINGWNTTAVTNMKYMFKDCSSLSSLDLNHFDTSSVTDMEGMFYGCISMKSLEVEKFNLTNVKTIEAMFMNCNKLSKLNIENWNTANISKISKLFANCKSLTSISIGKWDTSRVDDMSALFYGCKSLSNIDIGSWDVSNVTDMSGLFFDCSSVKSLSLSKWNVGNVKWLSYMFYGCKLLTEIKINNWDVKNVVNMNGLFKGCKALETISLNKWKTSSVSGYGMDSVFENCESLTTLDLSNWNTSNVESMSKVFRGCSSLTTLNISGWNTAKVLVMEDMFYGCASLKTIYASNSFVTKGLFSDLDLEENMFKGFTSLVGGNGTKYSSSHMGKEYARIDTASKPGYFTSK